MRHLAKGCFSLLLPPPSCNSVTEIPLSISLRAKWYPSSPCPPPLFCAIRALPVGYERRVTCEETCVTGETFYSAVRLKIRSYNDVMRHNMHRNKHDSHRHVRDPRCRSSHFHCQHDSNLLRPTTSRLEWVNCSDCKYQSTCYIIRGTKAQFHRSVSPEATIVLRCDALRGEAYSCRPTGIEGATKALASPAPAKINSEGGTFMPSDTAVLLVADVMICAALLLDAVERVERKGARHVLFLHPHPLFSPVEPPAPAA